MKLLYLFFSILSLFALSLSAQEETSGLTQDEKDALLAQLDELETQAVSINIKSQSEAISLLVEAIQSDTAAFKLYLECIEKIRFEDQKKKSSERRDGIKKIKEQSNKEFKRALRHQLYWLVHSIEAARNPDKRLEQALKLVQGLENIVEDTNYLNNKNVFGGPLSQNPFGSEIAKVLKIENLKPEGWPSGPLDFDGLYKNVVLKHLVEQGQFEAARNHWVTRIKAEQAIIEAYAKEPDTNVYGKTPVRLENFLEKKVPRLRWDAEEIFFNGGDERQSYINMFEIIKQYPEHDKYLSWIEWVRGNLVTDSSEAEQTEEAE